MLNKLDRLEAIRAIEIIAVKKCIAQVGIEKDFWTTWCLKKLFALPLAAGMVFKGGTSLAKGYNLIDRFSEDCDVTIDRAKLGFVNEKDPLRAPSRGKRDKLLKELKVVGSDYVTNIIRMSLQESIQAELSSETWRLEPDEEDPQALRFYYPRILPDDSYCECSYIKPGVLL